MQIIKIEKILSITKKIHVLNQFFILNRFMVCICVAVDIVFILKQISEKKNRNLTC